MDAREVRRLFIVDVEDCRVGGLTARICGLEWGLLQHEKSGLPDVTGDLLVCEFWIALGQLFGI